MVKYVYKHSVVCADQTRQLSRNIYISFFLKTIMKRGIFIILLSLVLISLFMIFVQANEPNNNTANSSLNTNNTNATSNNTDDKPINKSGPWKTRCQAVNHRVAGRIKMYEEKRDPHIFKFTNLMNILDKIITRADAKGFDTSALKEDKIKLDEMIKKFKDDYDLFIQKLMNTRNYTCGKSEGQYKNALNESKIQLGIVRQDSEDIKEFFKTTIREDIAKLKEQAKLKKEERKQAKEQNKSLNEAARKAREEQREQRIEQRESKIHNRIKVLEQMEKERGKRKK